MVDACLASYFVLQVFELLELGKLDTVERGKRASFCGSEASSGTVLIAVSGIYYPVLCKLRRKAGIRKYS